MQSPKTVIGFLAHVDAGKTSLIESLMYVSGTTRTFGRVDHRDAFLDTDKIEKERGITIYAKLAELSFNSRSYTLVDTPGHVDFSIEMERSLALLDYAVLVIAQGSVTGYDRMLFDMLCRHGIPVAVFINKMDMARISNSEAFKSISSDLTEKAVDFSSLDDESLADKSDLLMEKYIDGDIIKDDDISEAFRKGEIVPVLSGSALRNEGIDSFLDFIDRFTYQPAYPEDFGLEIAKLFYEKGMMYAMAKVTGGSLEVKSMLGIDKVDSIAISSGRTYELRKNAVAGEVVIISGLDHARAGDAYGIGKNRYDMELSPVLEYSLILPESCDPVRFFHDIKQIERQIPEIRARFDNRTKEIRMSVMGQVQLEILKRLILDRFGLDVGFSSGEIAYKETIEAPVEGIGHYEPLRHYAEVHVVLEPLSRGSGIEIESRVPVNDLAINWQHLIMTHLKEKEHIGVLTGSPLTDIRIVLTAGRAHLKHTEGGDFREATYRAVRQALMKARNILLEPVYSFELDIPVSCIGRASSDFSRMHAAMDPAEINGERALIRGLCPVSTIATYQKDVVSYTRGEGSLALFFNGYEKAHDAESVIKARGYDPDSDRENPSGSVFCSHGAGFFVPWNEVEEYMHISSTLDI